MVVAKDFVAPSIGPTFVSVSSLKDIYIYMLTPPPHDPHFRVEAWGVEG